MRQKIEKLNCQLNELIIQEKTEELEVECRPHNTTEEPEADIEQITDDRDDNWQMCDESEEKRFYARNVRKLVFYKTKLEEAE